MTNRDEGKRDHDDETVLELANRAAALSCEAAAVVERMGRVYLKFIIASISCRCSSISRWIWDYDQYSSYRLNGIAICSKPCRYRYHRLLLSHPMGIRSLMWIASISPRLKSVTVSWPPPPFFRSFCRLSATNSS